jgi:pilus assembly protein TadC
MSLQEKIVLFFVKRKLKEGNMLEKLKAAFGWLEGKKTYVMAAGGVLSEVAFMLGFITQEQLDSLRAIFGFGAAATFANKINRLLPLLKK